MFSLRSNTSRVAAAVMAGGATLAAMGVMQVVSPHQGDQAELHGVGDYLTLGFFALALVLISPGFLALADYARSRKGAIAAATGTAVLGLTCVTSLINGKDLVIFVVLAPLTNALWLFGSIALAVSLKRAGHVSKLVYIGLPLAWVFTIPASAVGGGVVAGAYWLTVGYLLSADALRREPRPQPVQAIA